MPVAVGPPGAHGQSMFDKFKMGALMGGTVGMTMGFIFGVTNIARFGAGADGVMRTLGRYMLGSGATFGFFMGVGSTIRTENSRSFAELAAFERAQRRGVVSVPSRPRRLFGADQHHRR